MDETERLLPRENTLPSPSEIATVIRKTVYTINALITVPIKSGDILRPQKTPISDRAVKYIHSLGGDASVYCALRAIGEFRILANADSANFELFQQRALGCQYLARSLLHTYQDKETLFLRVLTNRFGTDLDDKDDYESALELAVSYHATAFLSHPLVMQCVFALWDGTLMLNDDEEHEDFIFYRKLHDNSFWNRVDPIRLVVPKYMNAINLFISFLYLALFTWVVNDRRSYPSVAEWMLYVFIAGYILEDIRQLWNEWRFYFRSIWNWITIALNILYLTSFCYRMYALYGNHNDMAHYNDVAYDVLATSAIFLWIRVLSILDGFRFFGTMVLILQAMLKDGFLFFFMLAWVFIGFAQSFYALGDDKTELKGVAEMLARAFFQDPDFDKAESYHLVLGRGLFMLYMLISSVILLNLLIALFNDSYQNIVEGANSEYFCFFTFKVIRYLKIPDHYPFAPPFNIIEIFLILPLKPCISKHTYRQINRMVLIAIFWPALFAIASYEILQLRISTLKARPQEQDGVGRDRANDNIIHLGRQQFGWDMLTRPLVHNSIVFLNELEQGVLDEEIRLALFGEDDGDGGEQTKIMVEKLLDLVQELREDQKKLRAEVERLGKK
ncbi:uncharacterized protein VTP21DRAFT_7342 [Calcarisporiella thermophila]|uniref:uncharacterized protein n=1 Tax=Calcarisporiella thermophila TaxID=911321 RepID=UPI0037427868